MEYLIISVVVMKIVEAVGLWDGMVCVSGCL
jgi:hypothetical protein